MIIQQKAVMVQAVMPEPNRDILPPPTAQVVVLAGFCLVISQTPKKTKWLHPMIPLLLKKKKTKMNDKYIEPLASLPGFAPALVIKMDPYLNNMVIPGTNEHWISKLVFQEAAPCQYLCAASNQQNDK